MMVKNTKRLGEMTSLRSLLHRSFLFGALFAIGLTSLAITFAGALTVIQYANHSLSLLGRSIAYNTEAALVFNDRHAIDETLGYLTKTEELAEVLVYDENGKLISHWRDLKTGLLRRVERRIADTFLNQPFLQTVTYEGREVGHLAVSVRGSTLFTLLSSTVLILVGTLLISLVMIYWLAGYTRRRLIVPLARLSTVARSIAKERNFKHRVPRVKIKELNHLAEDFNSLLDEIQRWQGNMQKEHAILSKQARHDPLTGVLNRSQFEPALLVAIRDAQKDGNSCALLFIDCDDFKSINDKMGHMVGDTVLSAVAERLSMQVRKHDLVVRIGGDEFAVLLSPIHAPEDALFVADKMLNSLLTPIESTLLEQPLKVLVSVGIAVYPMHASTPTGLIGAADNAMYEAKRSKCGKYMDEGFSA